MKHTNFEIKQYNVPVKIKDHGNPPIEKTDIVAVTFCKCIQDNNCFLEAGQLGKPSVGEAVGIILGILAVIGLILAAIFLNMKYKEKKSVKKPIVKEAKNHSESEHLQNEKV
nr:PREDICTED: cadherin-17-like [Latimeria chalumnae]|eukprot:XP_006014313.1 PREDICTED: cadherin-17-like [Latimeria chalumnae]